MLSWPLSMNSCSLITLNPSLFKHTSLKTTNDQLEIEVKGKGGVASRFVANDSLSILKMHRVGLITISNPVHSSLQNKCTVL